MSFLTWTRTQANQVLDEENSLYIEEPCIPNGEKNDRIRNCCFPLPNEIIDLGNSYQWQLKLLDKWRRKLCNGWIRPITHVLISYGHCNKLPQTQWLKTTGMHSLIALETRSPQSVSFGGNGGVGRAMLSPEALGEEFVP